MNEQIWWKSLVNVIQYNLQIKDTPQMHPETIAGELKAAAADAVVINVGGIYAWYQSDIPFHHVNEYLSKDKELIQELITCCHKKGIRVVARFDFSKVDDVVYLQHPEWFVKNPAGEPLIFGSKRMGEWSLLLSTCINGGYRNEAFAVSVLEEAMERLDFDGIFFNAPQMEACYCENCRRKYRLYYGRELPDETAMWEKDWKKRCEQDNSKLLYQAVKSKNREMPVILYYGTYQADGKGEPEDLGAKYEAADMICTEAQDILSAGKLRLPYTWKPAINMKLGEYQNRPRPFGIIHSCPGMDWRHTGLPAAEYEAWLSQIPAANGQLWHSLTGFEKTISDKRLLRVMNRVNHKVQKLKPYMESAVPIADVLLLWNAKTSALGFAEALIKGHIAFTIRNPQDIGLEQMLEYSMIIVPNDFSMDSRILAMLKEYAASGKSLLIEKTDTKEIEEYAALLGISAKAETGKKIVAAYGEFQDAAAKYRKGLEAAEYIPIKDEVLYTGIEEGTTALLTYVPSFAPADGVGAPPERASIPVKHTDIPMVTLHKVGKGNVIGVYFGISEMILQYGLEDLKLLFENMVRVHTAGAFSVTVENVPEGVFLYPYQYEGGILLQLVNSVGERPLRSNVICTDLRLHLHMKEGYLVEKTESLLEKNQLSWKQEGSELDIIVDTLKVWDAITAVFHDK